MSTADDLERRIEKLQVTTRAQTDEHILEDAFTELESSAREKAAMGGQGVFLRTLGNGTKGLVAVAIVILVIFALFLSMPSAKAVTLAQIYQAVGRVRNICISEFTVNKGEPERREWISETLNVVFCETQKEFILLDYNKGERKTKSLKTNSIRTESLSPDVVKNGMEFLQGRFGLLPFSDILTAEMKGQWNQVDVNSISPVIPDTEVYDLTWISLNNETNTIYNKWRVFVDVKTDLPVRADWYKKELFHKMKSYSDDDYVLQTLKVVTYPTEAEILALIENIFGGTEQQSIE